MIPPDVLDESDRSLQNSFPAGHSRDASHRRSFASALVAAALLAACGDSAPSPEAVAQRDSAGVRIVVNQRPGWSDEEALALSPEPVVVIGAAGGREYDLSGVAGAARLADGTIVIGDGGSLQLRFYDPTGTYLRAAGGRGSGPGELTGMYKLERLPGDTLAVQASPSSISLFDGEGTFVRRLDLRALPLDLPGIPVILAPLAGGSFLVGSAGMTAPPATGNRWIDSIPLAVLGPDSTLRHRLGRFPAFELVMATQGPRQPLFASNAVFAASDRSFFWGIGSEHTIGMYSADGRLERSIRGRWAPVPITSADVDSFVEEDGRDQPHAEHVPGFSQLLVDRDGRLWVRAANLADASGSGQLMDSYPRVPSTWSVFDRDGLWLCDVTMPARFLAKDIGPDYVLGIARDSLDVQTVVQYGLRAGAQTR